MQVVMIRHGKTDYSYVEQRGFPGIGVNFAPLSELGVKQAEAVATDSALDGCQLIIASPFTRAMQTAAIISRVTGLEIRVEVDLHEWSPDSAHEETMLEHIADERYREYAELRGIHPSDRDVRWESAADVIARVQGVLDRYREYDKVAVVCHGVVIERVIGQDGIKYCTPYTVDLAPDHDYDRWWH